MFGRSGPGSMSGVWHAGTGYRCRRASRVGTNPNHGTAHHATASPERKVYVKASSGSS